MPFGKMCVWIETERPSSAFCATHKVAGNAMHRMRRTSVAEVQVEIVFTSVPPRHHCSVDLDCDE